MTTATSTAELERPDPTALRLYVNFRAERLAVVDGMLDVETLAARAVADLVDDGLMPTAGDIAEMLYLASAAVAHITPVLGRSGVSPKGRV